MAKHHKKKRRRVEDPAGGAGTARSRSGRRGPAGGAGDPGQRHGRQKTVTVEIAQGSSVGTIASGLRQAGVIRFPGCSAGMSVMRMRPQNCSTARLS